MKIGAPLIPAVSLMLIISAATFLSSHAQDKLVTPVKGSSGPVPSSSTVGVLKTEAPKPLTAEEKLAVRSAQVRLLQAQSQAQAAQQQLAAAQQGMMETVNAAYAARKISQADYALCDNPGPGACAKAPAGDLTLQAIPKPEKEEKK